tara:strand:- start:229 stop:504 length:276 start_codon:yes stop_codon:yes gene_type:complete
MRTLSVEQFLAVEPTDKVQRKGLGNGLYGLVIAKNKKKITNKKTYFGNEKSLIIPFLDLGSNLSKLTKSTDSIIFLQDKLTHHKITKVLVL